MDPPEEKQTMIRATLLLCVSGLAASGCVSTTVKTAARPPGTDSTSEITQRFEGVARIVLHTTCGDCRVAVHDDAAVQVRVQYDVTLRGAVEPRMALDAEAGVLTLTEQWREGPSTGDIIWILAVPKATEIHFVSSSGDFAAEGLQGGVIAYTASGDVVVTNHTGAVCVDSTSGNVEADAVVGNVRVHTVSGDVRVCAITGDVEVHSSSGDITCSDCLGRMELISISGQIIKE
jgi:hypothetical protein